MRSARPGSTSSRSNGRIRRRSTHSRRRPSSSSSTAGRRSAARSGSTRTASGATARTCARRSSRSSTRATRPNGARGLQGKSSGGYGAIVNALARPDLFHAFAAHAPDALFEVTLAHGFPAAARALAQRGVARWPSSGGRSPGWTSRETRCSSSSARVRSRSATASCRSTSETAALVARSAGTVARPRPGAPGRRAAGPPSPDCAASGSTPATATSTSSTAARSHFNVRSGARACPRSACTSSSSPAATAGIGHRYPLSLAYLVGSLSITF